MRGMLAQEIGMAVGDGELHAGSAVLDLPHAAELIPVSRRGLIAEPRLALTGHAGGRIRRVIAADIDAVNLLDLVGRQQEFRSEEHTSELQSLMRNSYAVFCLKKKKTMNMRQ